MDRIRGRRPASKLLWLALRPCELTGLILLAGQARGHYIFLLWPERSIKTELFDAEVLRFEGHLALAKDASASVGQVAGICNTASMRPPFSMTLSVARTDGDGGRLLNRENRKVAWFEAKRTD